MPLIASPGLLLDAVSASSVSVPEDATRYKPNLSEDEPLFSASTCNPGAVSGLWPGEVGSVFTTSSASPALRADPRRAR